MGEAPKDLRLKPSKIDNSLYMDPELLSGDDQPVRDMMRKLKQKFFVKKVDFLAKVGDTIERCSSSQSSIPQSSPFVPFPADTVGFAPKFRWVVGVLSNEILCPMSCAASILD